MPIALCSRYLYYTVTEKVSLELVVPVQFDRLLKFSVSSTA